MKDLAQDPLRFASLVAHQLKGPVTGVQGILQTVLGEYAGPLTKKQRELLEKAVVRCQESITAAQRLMSITKALDHPTDFDGGADFATIFRQVENRYREPALSKQISLNFNIRCDQTQARGFEPALTEVVEALVHNALKYTPNHGRINVVLEDGIEDDSLRLSVGDSGIGVAEDERAKLFQPFYRTLSAQQSSRPGTGLGLAFVKTITEAAGGMVSVGKSELGGAEFVVTLNAAEAIASEHEGDAKMHNAFKVVIVGGVTAGPKVAAKVMRLMPNAEVTVIEKGKLLSYAGCGLPFYVAGIVQNQKRLMSSAVGEVRDSVFFQKVKNVTTLNQTEAFKIDRERKQVLIRENLTGQESTLKYDKLVLATGGMPIIPEIPGTELRNVFSLHGPADAEGVKAALETGRAHDVVIIGGGLIGIEMTEAFCHKGCRVTILEKREQIMRLLDWEMAQLLEQHLERHGVRVLIDTQVEKLIGDVDVNSVQCNRGAIPASMVVMAVGSRPNVELAKDAGLEIGVTGGIHTDEYMRTSDENIYAAGDCVESVNIITGEAQYTPLGSTANKQGRVVAVNICGGQEKFPGILGSISCKVFDYAVAKTGLTEYDARQKGYEVVTVLVPAPDKEHFVPGAQMLMLKLVVDAQSRQLLGAQAVGPGDGDKRIDIAVMAIAGKMTVDQIANMDLCYCPSFSPVMDNIITAANVARNKLDRQMTGITPMEVKQRLDQNNDFVLLDVRTPLEVEQVRLAKAVHIPLGALRERLSELDKNKEIVAFCNYSLRGYEAAIILKAAGFENVSVMDGGLEMWPYEKQ